MPRQPTEAELTILQVLWELGPSTVRAIHNKLTEAKDVGYATTVKMLVIMYEKGLVTRDDSVRPQIYKSAVTKRSTQLSMLNELVRQVYDGSAMSLVQHLVSSKKTTKEELQQLLEELNGGSK